MLVSMAKMTGRVGVVLVGLWAGLAVATAQETPAPPAAATQDGAAPNADAAAPQDNVKQIKLTEDQVKRFIAAQTDLAAIASKIQAAGDSPIRRCRRNSKASRRSTDLEIFLSSTTSQRTSRS